VNIAANSQAPSREEHKLQELYITRAVMILSSISFTLKEKCLVSISCMKQSFTVSSVYHRPVDKKLHLEKKKKHDSGESFQSFTA